MNKNETYTVCNDLTKPEHYKRCNLSLLDAYNALHPGTLTKVSYILFTCIMDTKMHRQPTAKDYSITEDKRIYNNKYISLEDILDRYNPSKYKVDGKDMKNDMSNLMSRLQELDDNNIFYIWRYGKPFSYMFVMERNISLWKYYNKLAYVTPKTVSKVIESFHGMVREMFKFESSKNPTAQLKDVEDSFLSVFLPHMISKMKPIVGDKLPILNGVENSSEYLQKLRDIIGTMDEKEGFDIDEDFCKRLPIHLVNKLEGKSKDETQNREEPKVNIDQLSKDLVPKEQDLVKEKKLKAKKIIHTDSDSGDPKYSSIRPAKITFETAASENPFANCNQLTTYYRDVIKLHNSKARFYPFDSERLVATHIMDLMIKNGKEGNVDFLKAWINYYIGSYLQGNNIFKPGKTSLSSFQKTFSTYESKYFKA